MRNVLLAVGQSLSDDLADLGDIFVLEHRVWQIDFLGFRG
jgi:hypothetical protein